MTIVGCLNASGWYGVLWKSSNPFLQGQTVSRCVKIMSYFASFNQEEFVSLVSLSSKSSLFLAFLTFRIAAFTFPSVLLLIWSLIKEFNGGMTTMTGCIGESVWHLDREQPRSQGPLSTSRKYPGYGWSRVYTCQLQTHRGWVLNKRQLQLHLSSSPPFDHISGIC